MPNAEARFQQLASSRWGELEWNGMRRALPTTGINADGVKSQLCADKLQTKVGLEVAVASSAGKTN